MNTLIDHCPGCNSAMEPFYTFENVPTNSCILMSSVEEAKNYPRGDIVLGHCKNCGFIGNLAFKPELTEYSGKYEETQGYSPTFQQYHQQLASDLITRYRLHDKTVLEIGCGKGEFLAMLCEQGDNRGVGFDPGYDSDRQIFQDSERVQVVQDFYSEKYHDYQADFVCCKMTLEHIQQTSDFVGLCRQALSRQGKSVFYLQVPESLRILRDCAFEDIYYEHCSYFTPGSLARLFRALDMRVLKIDIQYQGQYLAIEAELASSEETGEISFPIENDLDLTTSLVDSFARRCDEKVNYWQTEMAKLATRGPVFLWGSGSKAVSFLSMADTAQQISKVVDINPYRQGHYMPGTGQPIIAPKELREQQPAAIIIMNPVYRQEIKAELDQMQVKADLLTL